MYTCLLLILIFPYFDEMFMSDMLYSFVNFMFVLAELWLITYICDVGTKGKQVPVPDAC